MRILRVLSLAVGLALIAAFLPAAVTGSPSARASHGGPHAASGFRSVKLNDQVTCTGVVDFFGAYFQRGECGYTIFQVNDSDAGMQSSLSVDFVGPDGTAFLTDQPVVHGGGTEWEVNFDTGPAWPAGEITVRVDLDGTPIGESSGALFHNYLGADVQADTNPRADRDHYEPGDDIVVSGNVHQLNSVTAATSQTGVPAEFSLRAVASDGSELGSFGPFTAGSEGDFTETIPGTATASLSPGPETDFRTSIAVQVVDGSYEDTGPPPGEGTWAARHSGQTGVELRRQPDVLLMRNSYVSSTGWVKPGDQYPFRIIVENLTDSAASDVTVTIPAPPVGGDPTLAFTGAVTLNDTGAVSVTPTEITWTIADLPGVDAEGVGTSATLVVEARADELAEDPEIVWKDLSTTARLDYAENPGPTITAESHGPKVIPPTGGHETARYGDKPFPMVPVDYTDRKHQSANPGDELSRIVNDPNFDGSTFNLYQEMSYGQLYPDGTVPSAGVATAGFDYAPGFDFTTPSRDRTCRGTTYAELAESGDFDDEVYGSAFYPDRIVNGWYQLPGDTEYYGGDFPAFTATTSGIDQACGQIGKAVYDAAQIADPEIDYNEYDSDKDGVVDFFMMVFVGCGGNGPSQLALTCPYDDEPYDNIWPHSSSLEMQYRDEATGLRGYVSDDQLKSRTEVPQCWTSEARTGYDDCAANGGSGLDTMPVHVRVGPYNVNPETVYEANSVISHEYGHHLGLPDFYASYAAYNDWNLMAADYAQHMTVFSKQDLGWVVPDYLSSTTEVTDWQEIKQDTGSITWTRPDGTTYTLSEANGDQNIHNGQAYGLKLPQRLLIDPQKVADQASASHVWYSGRGNDFGCSPTGGHNLDVYLPELRDVADGSTVTVTFRSSWDIEWDWDYGFVLTSTDGEDYVAHESQEGYSTPNSFNPNGQQCFEDHQYGLTGTSGSYQSGTFALDRAAADYSAGSPFLDDSYDISRLVGAENPVLRLSYFTDAAFDRPGWFIDDLVVSVDGEPIYESDFEGGVEDGRLFPGGCDPDGIDVAVQCTDGWQRIRADEGAPLDHAYYLELRDQTGFDFNGHGQSDRGDTGWGPGVLIEYTDEARGYGNSGSSQPPNQHYLDSQPNPGADCENDEGTLVSAGPFVCRDAAFTAAEGDSRFSDAVTDDQPGGWIDNFDDPNSDYDDDLWHFDYGCLSLDVTSMSGEEPGPEPPAASDLTADATISVGDGCAGLQPQGNSAPTAAAQAKPQETQAGESVTFDGSGSFDPDGDALAHSWDFDASDGVQQDATGETVSHRYDEPGEYTATLTVDDGNGATGTDTVQIRVTEATDTNRAPQAAAEATTRVVLGDEVTFDARRSSDPDGDDLDYQWAFGDGSTDAGALVSHAYGSRGDKTATVTVRDGRGGKDTASASTRVVEVERVFGADRIGTALEVARERFDQAGEVVLATAGTYADALSGAPFAAQRDAPILLNPQGSLHADVRAALEDLEAGTVHLLGGEHALSQRVEDELERMGLRVRRFAGADRFDTARLIGAEVGGDEVYIAEGDDPDPSRGWPDAMIASPVAASSERPILLVTTGAAPGATLDALEDLDVTSATIVGGTVAVSQAVEDELERRGVAVDRVAGADRFDTSRRMAERAQGMGMSPAETWLSRGDHWPDSLTAGPVVGDTGGILLLVHRAGLSSSAPSEEWLEDEVGELMLVRLLGGSQAISQAVEDEVEDLIRSP